MSTSSADQRFTLPLDSSESNLNTTGGKGHNLAILSRDGNFPVPPGFVVTVAAYHHYVSSSPGLLSDIEAALSKLHVNNESPSTGTAKLEDISDAIKEPSAREMFPRICGTKLPNVSRPTPSFQISTTHTWPFGRRQLAKICPMQALLGSTTQCST